MCTSITFSSGDSYFGRNLDLEYSYEETVTVTPRHFPLEFRRVKPMHHHHAMIGMAYVSDNYPLYYDATNEFGLSMAGLNFPGNAVYFPYTPEKQNITPFELIPWILGQCESVSKAETMLKKLNLWNEPFSKEFPLSPLHWILADRERCLVLEPMAEGLKVWENSVGILTNNPPFDYHTHNLAYHMNLTPMQPQNRFSSKIELEPFSLGMGSIGLPGDMSSPSRFVKAAFTKLNSRCGDSESESISQFFHILGSVVQPRGLTNVRGEEYEFTLYSSCCNTDKGIYYYKTYENSQISAVDIHRENLDSRKLVSYPLIQSQQIYFQN